MANVQPTGEKKEMRIYRTSKFDKLVKEAMAKEDTYSGNCGMYAIALAKKALDNKKTPSIVISTNTDDLDELMYGEPDIYHVAVIIDGKLYDGSGEINQNTLEAYGRALYNNPNPIILELEFNDDLIKMIRQQTNWDTPWQEYYNDIKNQSIQIPQTLYHATYKPLLDSIMKNGLGGNNTKNWEDSVSGTVYLAYDKYQAESYAETSDMVPEDWLDEIVVLQINTNGLDESLFSVDKNNLSGDTLEYIGIIPPKNIKVL